MRPVVSVDIGGTKIAAACFREGALSERGQIPTESGRDADEVLADIVSLIRDTAQRGGLSVLDRVGVACPGPLSPSKGVVVRAPTLGWREYPIARALGDALGARVALENDANAAAYGEWLYGAGRGTRSAAYVTISTGVGCGIVLNGEILRGAHEGAGEIGHLHMVDGGEPCLCGREGCLEAYASGTAIGRLFRRAARAQGRTGWERLTAKEAAESARAGDEDALRIFRLAGDMLGKAFAALQMLLDVEVIILGGSVCAQLDLMRSSIIGAATRYSYWGEDAETWLRMSALGENAALLGVGALSVRRL